MASWWLDERAFAGAEHLDPTYVDGYDAKAQYDPTDDIDALTALGLGTGSTILDIGAGTGVFSIAAAAVGAQVTAVDVSPAMISVLRERLPAVDVALGGFLSYEHDAEQYDFVFSRNALHQLPDFWKAIALRRIATIVKPGGILRLRDLVFDVGPDEIETTVDAWMSGAVDDPATGYTAEDLATHLREEFSTFTWLLEPMLERAGFAILDREVRRGVYAAYTCRQDG